MVGTDRMESMPLLHGGDAKSTKVLQNSASINEFKLDEDLCEEYIDRRAKLNRALLSWALGAGSVGTVWEMKLKSTLILGIWIFRICSILSMVSILTAIICGAQTWIRSKSWFHHPQFGVAAKLTAALCAGTMATMDAGVNLKLMLPTSQAIDVFSQVIFIVGLVGHLVVSMICFYMRFSNGDRLRKMIPKAQLSSQFELSPLFLIPPVGSGISFRAALLYGGQYEDVAWVLLYWGILHVVLGFVPELLHSRNTMKSEIPTELVTIPIFIAPPSLMLGAFMALTEKKILRWEIPQIWEEAIMWLLFSMLIIAVLVNVVLQKKLWRCILKTNSAPYFSSGTFPLVAMSFAVLKLSERVESDNLERLGWASLGVASTTIVLTMVSIIRALAVLFHQGRPSCPQQDPDV